MKKASIVAGIVLLLIGLLNVTRYLADYKDLAPYGKGFVFGNLLLLGLGLWAVLFGAKKGKKLF